MDDKLEKRWKIHEGVRLACKYSLNCGNAKLFLGEIRAYLDGARTAQETESLLMKLNSYGHYRAIGKMNRIGSPFARDVISFYWKGTPRLEGERWHNYTTLIPILNMPIEYIDTNIINECLVHPAKVIKIQKTSIVIKYREIIKKAGELSIATKPSVKTIANLTEKNMRTGDRVTIHFSTAIEKINANEFSTLQDITCRSLEIFNKKHKRGRKPSHASPVQ